MNHPWLELDFGLWTLCPGRSQHSDLHVQPLKLVPSSCRPCDIHPPSLAGDPRDRQYYLKDDQPITGHRRWNVGARDSCDDRKMDQTKSCPSKPTVSQSLMSKDCFASKVSNITDRVTVPTSHVAHPCRQGVDQAPSEIPSHESRGALKSSSCLKGFLAMQGPGIELNACCNRVFHGGLPSSCP